MIKLYDASSGSVIGEVSDEQLAFLQEQFEEEWEGDQDYYLNGATLDMLKDAGADASLVALLERAMGQRGEVDIRWSRE
jgi:processive 1,2-diacylglycerol beta-glucosyltransferase